MPNYTVEQKSRNAFVVRMVPAVTKGWEQWFLLRSDAHHDNPHCDRTLETKHLKQAKERGAGIIDAGDLFCAMQGKYDKRSAKGDLRPEHQNGDYLDALVRTTAEDYADYANSFIVIGRGNHETGIYKNHETDLTERLVERMNTLYGSKIYAGGYGNWIRFQCNRGQQRQSFRYRGFHGAGGGAPVTKGTIQAQRNALRWCDANIVHTGHVHNEYLVTHTRDRITDADVQYHDEQVHICTPGYKNDYADGFGGWEVERGSDPKPRGAAWLRFFFDYVKEKFAFEVSRAK